MSANPCKVCNSTDLNLVDGYYYCVECGTQDTEARETVIEHTMLADGTFAIAEVKKYKTVVKDGVEMSEEWYQWHAYNFILCGLSDELLSLGANPSVKIKLLWIWATYVKKYQNKEKIGPVQDIEDKINGEEECDNIKNVDEENFIEDSIRKDEVLNNSESKYKKSFKLKEKQFSKITQRLLLAMIYLALNLDRSDIQLSHLFKFVKERRLSLYGCHKFIPKELQTPHVKHLSHNLKLGNSFSIYETLHLALGLLNILDLGIPVVPDLKKIVENNIKELCLPDDFKMLVFSLMHLEPCHLEIDKMTKFIPSYEIVVMSYIMVAFKICFGLDDDHEITLSNAVHKVNRTYNYEKYYKLATFSSPSDRLFSFREWCTYFQFRKLILNRYNWPIADCSNVETDDFVFMEHLKERPTKAKDISEEITMDTINKVSTINIGITNGVIPIEEFTPTLTPLTSYTEVIINHVQESELKLSLSEDFTQYSIKYASRDLSLFHDLENDINLCTGVSIGNKIINTDYIKYPETTRANKTSMVFIRNCENKNWLKTNPPSLNHIKKLDSEIESDTEVDLGYDGTTDNIDDCDVQLETPIKHEKITDEENNISIFDDNFYDSDQCLLDDTKYDKSNEVVENDLCMEASNLNDTKLECLDREENISNTTSIPYFHPETFNREQITKEIIVGACKKYKIPIPQTYSQKKARKRNVTPDKSVGSKAKRSKIENKSNRSENTQYLNSILSSYQSYLEKEIVNEVTNHIKSIIQETYIENINDSNTADLNFENATINNDFCNKSESNLDDINVNEEIMTENNTKCGDADVETKIDSDKSLISENDPNFDEKLYDIKQLYIKFKDKMEFEDIFDVDIEPELDELITEMINEESKSDSPQQIDNSGISCKDKEYSENNNISKLEKLIKGRNLERFNYWFRHISDISKVKQFDDELDHNFPKSFAFVIRECASIIECTPLDIYKKLQTLEKQLVGESKLRAKKRSKKENNNLDSKQKSTRCIKIKPKRRK